MKKSIISFTLLLFVTFVGLNAQEKTKIQLDAGLDLATTYLWRGFEFGDGPVVQPWAQLSYGNIAAGIWSTTNFTGNSKEVDLFLKYNIKDFTLSFTDLYTIVNNGVQQNYFDFEKETTEHIAEAGLSFNGTDAFPLTIYGGILVYGLAYDSQIEDATKLNHSTYFEFAYPGQIKDYSYSLFAGFVPFKSGFYQNEKFSFINVGFNVAKEIRITDQFSIPTNFTLASSPERKTVCFAVKCSL